MREKKIVIFDLDDTLLPNVHYYRRTKEKLAEVFNRIFNGQVSKDDFIQTYGKIDMEKTKVLGLNRLRFPLSAVETYYYYCNLLGKEIIIDETQDIIVTANSVFEEVPPLAPTHNKVIRELTKEGYQICLLTSGDDIIQVYKIYRSGLYKVIDENNIIVVPHKDESTYKRLFGCYGLENCVMVGNSKKSDINPALEVGMYAIHIPEETWEFEVAVLKESDKLYSISSITKVPELVYKIFR